MRYLCLVYGEEKEMAALSESDFDALVRDALSYDEELRRSGHYVISNALQSVRTATSLRLRNDQLSVTDGPFAETKEQLLGFILIEARDRDDAVSAAAKIPMARFGTIEVRPVRELPGEHP
jgi:hypothetical protein